MSYFVSTDKVRLHYTDRGSGKTVVLVSGYGAPAGIWKLMEDVLIEKGYRVINFERRSHGKSENSRQGQHLCRHAADLHELLELLSIEKPILIGHSMGASTLYAYFSVCSDKDIEAAVFIDQTPCMLNKSDWIYGMYQLNQSNMGTFFDNPLPDGFYRDPKEGFLEPFKEVIDETKNFDRVGTKPLLLDHAYTDWRDVFPTLNIPVLFMAAENSILWSSDHAAVCADMCANGRSVVIPKCGHAVMVERPDLCNEIVIDFFREIEVR